MVERRGRREGRRPLSSLRSMRLSGQARRSAVLVFPRALVVIPSQSWRRAGLVEDRSEAYAPFIRALAAQAAEAAPGARFLAGAVQLRSGLIWMALLMGGGAAILLAAAVMADFADFGLALAARLVFVMILALAALPWIDRRAGAFDPRAIDPALLGAR